MGAVESRFGFGDDALPGRVHWGDRGGDVVGGGACFDGRAGGGGAGEQIECGSVALELVGLAAEAEVIGRLGAGEGEQLEVRRDGAEERRIGDLDEDAAAGLAGVLFEARAKLRAIL